RCPLAPGPEDYSMKHIIERVRGVRLEHDDTRPSPWGVWVEVRMGTKGSPYYKAIRRKRAFANESDARIAYQAACEEIAQQRTQIDDDEQRHRDLATSALPVAPRGTVLFETLANEWLELHAKH